MAAWRSRARIRFGLVQEFLGVRLVGHGGLVRGLALLRRLTMRSSGGTGLHFLMCAS
jgi:hypothetical protein